MPAVEGLRSPYDKTLGGLHHLGRMIDKIRLKQAGKLPDQFNRNYGLSVGLDGQLCGFLGVSFKEVEARVLDGGTDAEIAEWVLSQGLRPNRTQSFVWNEHSRKLGWSDRVTPFLQKQLAEAGLPSDAAAVSFDFLELDEGRVPIAGRSS